MRRTITTLWVLPWPVTTTVWPSPTSPPAIFWSPSFPGLIYTSWLMSCTTGNRGRFWWLKKYRKKWPDWHGRLLLWSPQDRRGSSNRQQPVSVFASIFKWFPWRVLAVSIWMLQWRQPVRSWPISRRRKKRGWNTLPQFVLIFWMILCAWIFLPVVTWNSSGQSGRIKPMAPCCGSWTGQ